MYNTFIELAYKTESRPLVAHLLLTASLMLHCREIGVGRRSLAFWTCASHGPLYGVGDAGTEYISKTNAGAFNNRQFPNPRTIYPRPDRSSSVASTLIYDYPHGIDVTAKSSWGRSRHHGQSSNRGPLPRSPNVPLPVPSNSVVRTVRRYLTHV